MTWRAYIVPVLVVFAAALLMKWGAGTQLPAANLQQISLPPSSTHIFGTSPQGRDLFRLSLTLMVRATAESVWATALTTVFGMLLGFTAAIAPGSLFDRAQMGLTRLLDSVGPFVFAV